MLRFLPGKSKKKSTTSDGIELVEFQAPPPTTNEGALLLLFSHFKRKELFKLKPITKQWNGLVNNTIYTDIQLEYLQILKEYNHQKTHFFERKSIQAQRHHFLTCIINSLYDLKTVREKILFLRDRRIGIDQETENAIDLFTTLMKLEKVTIAYHLKKKGETEIVELFDDIRKTTRLLLAGTTAWNLAIGLSLHPTIGLSYLSQLVAVIENDVFLQNDPDSLKPYLKELEEIIHLNKDLHKKDGKYSDVMTLETRFIRRSDAITKTLEHRNQQDIATRLAASSRISAGVSFVPI